MGEHEDIIRDTVRANRALGSAGQADLVWGHVSLRDPDGDGVWIKTAGYGFAEIDAERVVLVAPDGQVRWGGGRRHIEYPIHTEVMAARPDVGAVVHTHAKFVLAFTALDVPLRAISHDGVMFAEPQLPRFTETGSLINTPELGRALAKTLDDANACFIPQHGLVTVGPDAATAVMRAVLLDRACEIQLLAMAAGPLVAWSSEDEVQRKVREAWPTSAIDDGYEYLCRMSGLE